MKLIDKVLSHYDNQGRLKVEVPEWADDEFDGIIYYSPVTLYERNKLMPELKGELGLCRQRHLYEVRGRRRQQAIHA